MSIEFTDWWKALSADEKREAAESLGMAQGHLQNVAGRLRPVTADLGVALELYTGGALDAEMLCSLLTWRRLPDKRWPHPKGKPFLDVLPAEAT